jgi:hypothetical protein
MTPEEVRTLVRDIATEASDRYRRELAAHLAELRAEITTTAQYALDAEPAVRGWFAGALETLDAMDAIVAIPPDVTAVQR